MATFNNPEYFVSTKFVIQYFFWVMKCEVVVIIDKLSGVFICWYFVQLRAQQDEERKELSELRNEIKSQLQLDKDVSPFTVYFIFKLKKN